MSERMNELRGIVAEILEREPEEIDDTSDFREKYEADSLRAVEILSRIEKRYRVEIPQSSLAYMQNLKAVYEVVALHAGWQD